MRGGGLEPLRVQFPEAFFHSLRVLRLKQCGWPGNPASGLPQTDATGGGGGGGGVRIHRDFGASRLAGAENTQTVNSGLATLIMLQ